LPAARKIHPSTLAGTWRKAKLRGYAARLGDLFVAGWRFEQADEKTIHKTNGATVDVFTRHCPFE
jgi:hypothetical protein